MACANYFGIITLDQAEQPNVLRQYRYSGADGVAYDRQRKVLSPYTYYHSRSAQNRSEYLKSEANLLLEEYICQEPRAGS